VAKPAEAAIITVITNGRTSVPRCQAVASANGNMIAADALWVSTSVIKSVVA
jgi:hypothetical protein